LSEFEVWRIKQYCVFELSQNFGYGGGLERKLYIAVGHPIGDRLYALKTTSKMSWYNVQPERKSFSVEYDVGAVTCLDKKTMIEPHNGFYFSYADIEAQHADGSFSVRGQLPSNFPSLLQAAIHNSRTHVRGVLDGVKLAQLEAAMVSPVGDPPK
jgi:hypothetical protein